LEDSESKEIEQDLKPEDLDTSQASMCLTEFDESHMTKFSSNTGVPGMLDRSFEKEEVEVEVEPLA